ncbi:alpha/beta hydrolase [Paenibacillus sp. JX-17]|uniref:Alpha/beta hydrolase n=1 Tax=Paenibacillus lacisoli TaxID=3064525 RepID=A0ABT9CDZ0_9BACL|nr:alpha/beta hydrolase [Paenibacillus sp. JX-17]MDO7907499.1 alpha/beta hydrolase [Paenibacillus sp. JX-17]
MPYCKVKKANIYYEEIGEGKPVIMIHGFSPDHRLMSGCMEPIFQHIPGWRRIYIDLPGMGHTKDYDQIHSSDDMLEAVLDFIETMVPDQDYLIAGESYGGYITRGIIHRHKDRIGGAALICPLIIPEHRRRIVPEHAVIHCDREFMDTLSEEQRNDFSANQVVLNEYNWKRYTDEIVSGCKIADYEFLDHIQERYSFSANVDEFVFDKPTVFTLGRQDAVVGYVDAFRILDHYPRATFAVLDRAGHNLQIEQAQLFESLICDWLERVTESGF